MPGWLSFLIVLAASAGLLALAWWSLRREVAAALAGWVISRRSLAPAWDWNGLVYRAARLGLSLTCRTSRVCVHRCLQPGSERLGAVPRSETIVEGLPRGVIDASTNMGVFYSSSAAVYRYAGGPVQQPMLIVILCAAISALAVLFTWAFARRAWDHQVAAVAAWIVALYPEAVLLGSSQMREAFTIPLVMAAFYGLILLIQTHARSSLWWILGALVLCLPFSPPFAGLLLILLLLLGLILSPELRRARIWRQRRTWILLGGVVLLIGAGVWLSWGSFAPEGVSTPVGLVGWWVKKSADWQAHLTERASGLVQLIFERTPDWTHLPALLAYGFTQPFLPAAIGDTTGARRLASHRDRSGSRLDVDAAFYDLCAGAGTAKYRRAGEQRATNAGWCLGSAWSCGLAS